MNFIVIKTRHQVVCGQLVQNSTKSEAVSLVSAGFIVHSLTTSYLIPFVPFLVLGSMFRRVS